MDYKLPKRVENSNKATYGRVVNIAGSDYMPGAAILSSVSALKIGCGYCFLVSTERVINAVAAQTQNIVFVPISKLLETISSADVVEIGCGLSLEKTSYEIFETVIENLDRNIPLVIDADGLNILSGMRDKFLSKNFESVILTPHPKEAARLLNCSLEDVLSDVEASALKISNLYKCVVVLKTHKSCIISHTGEKYINSTGNNSMAKAGSGDVLCGMISGLLAQGVKPFEAAALGAYLHGMCGDFAKEELTEYSVMAEDLISYLPKAISFYSKKN